MKTDIEEVNALFVKHSREYQEKISQLESALKVAEEALKTIAHYNYDTTPEIEAKKALESIAKLRGEGENE